MSKLTIDEIREARDKCALIISKYGEKYLPIFERLDNELEMRERQQILLQKALKISTQISTQNSTQIIHQK